MGKLVLTPELFTHFSAVLREAAGLQFDESRLLALQTQLRDRVRARHLAGFDEYLQLLRDTREGAAEVQHLVEEVTIHETSFFRNQEHFKALNTVVIPALANAERPESPARTLRIWSAGCSTGEEPYSLAIACLEHPALAGWEIQILATDISRPVLETAREGLYAADTLRNMAPDRVRHWFTNLAAEAPSGTPGSGPLAAPAKIAHPRLGTGPINTLICGARRQFRVKDEVRRLITFAPHNLARLPYDAEIYSRSDLVFCENVLIYATPALVQQVVDQFYRCLNPGGYLFLGYAETLWRVPNQFQMVTTPTTFFYQRPAPASAWPVVLPAGRAHGAGPAQPSPDDPRARRFYITAEPTPPPAPGPPAAADRPARPPLALGAAADRRPAPAASRAVPDRATTLPRRAAPPPGAAALTSEAQEATRAGRDLLEAGRYDEARAAFEQALVRAPSAVEALVGLAQIHANQGRPVDAIAACQRALSLDNLCEEAHLLLGLIYRQQHQHGSAIDHFAKAIYINVASVPGHFHLAELYRSQGAGAEAAREYRRTLRALDQTHTGDTISGLPVAMIRKACEQQLRRLNEHHAPGSRARS